eukprot:g31910.t1
MFEAAGRDPEGRDPESCEEQARQTLEVAANCIPNAVDAINRCRSPNTATKVSTALQDFAGFTEKSVALGLPLVKKKKPKGQKRQEQASSEWLHRRQRLNRGISAWPPPQPVWLLEPHERWKKDPPLEPVPLPHTGRFQRRDSTQRRGSSVFGINFTVTDHGHIFGALAGDDEAVCELPWPCSSVVPEQKSFGWIKDQGTKKSLPSVTSRQNMTVEDVMAWRLSHRFRQRRVEPVLQNMWQEQEDPELDQLVEKYRDYALNRKRHIRTVACKRIDELEKQTQENRAAIAILNDGTIEANAEATTKENVVELVSHKQTAVGILVLFMDEGFEPTVLDKWSFSTAATESPSDNLDFQTDDDDLTPKAKPLPPATQPQVGQPNSSLGKFHISTCMVQPMPSIVATATEPDMSQPNADSPPMGMAHRWSRKNSSMGALSSDARTFTKKYNKGRLSIVSENKVHFQGTVHYSVQFTEGELCSADGVGFILSSDLPCTRKLEEVQQIRKNAETAVEVLML